LASATPRRAARLIGAAALCVYAGAGVGQERSDTLWYAIDAAEPAAAPAPLSFDRSSPRATMRSFLSAADAGRFETAAAALRPAPGVEAAPATLARMLAEVIRRQVWLNLESLSDRADAVSETGRNDPVAGRPRRSVPIASLEHGRFPATIRLNRYRAPGGDPVWLFPEQTTARIPALFDRYGPGWLETRLPEWCRGPTGLGVRRWELAALPLLGVAATIVACAVSAALGLLRRALPYRWLRSGFDAARTPLGLLAGALAARFAVVGALGFSSPITAILNPGLLIVVAIAVMMALLRVIDAALDRITHRYVGDIDDRSSRDERQFYTSIYAARRLVTLIAFLFVVGVLMWEIDAFGDLGLSLVASAGVLTVILGFAAQTALGNILASLQIAIAKPIRIGDSVFYEDQWCYVESIYYTFVRLRSWDERRMIVPVQHLISHPFENWSMTDAKLTETFALALDHDAEPEALRDAFETIAGEDPDVMAGETLKMQVIEHRPEAQILRFYATASDPSTAWTMHTRLREAMLAWVRANHPEWWPRERLREPERDAAIAAR
jgi:small-conductance mechanosensitive channel